MGCVTETFDQNEIIFYSGNVPFGEGSIAISDPYLQRYDSLTKERVGTRDASVVAINVKVELTIMPMQSKINVPVLRDIISHLLQSRDFLGYQLSYCKGNMTEEQFRDIKSQYLDISDKYDANSIAYYAFLLMKSMSIAFDADQISTMFKCDIDVAEEALAKIIID